MNNSKNSSISSIADKDKMVMNIQLQRECKKKQMKQDYRVLKENVKDNPHLQLAINEYEKYFAIEKQQLKALKALLKQVNTLDDQKQIKHVITTLEKNAL
jgi:hypothetical protein